MINIRKIHEQAMLKAVEAVSDTKVADYIVYGVHNPPEDDATWVKSTMKRLEEHFAQVTIKQIRMDCQCGWCMDEKIELVKRLVKLTTNLEEFANHDEAKKAGLSFADGELYLQFPFCPCPMLAEVDKLETNSWCQCTTGYSKVLFEQAFCCEVDVELLKSVKMGDDICLMKIVPLGAIWR